MEYSLGLYEKAIPLGLGFSRMFEITRRGGFDRLEIAIDETDWRMGRLDWAPEKQREVGILSRAEGTPLRTMCLSALRKYPLGSHDPKVREKSVEIVKKAIDFCVNADISILQMSGYDVYYEESDEETRKYFLENLVLVTDYAAYNGIFLAFETMEKPFMDQVEKAMTYVKLVDSPYLSVYPDIGNLQNAAEKYGTDVIEDMKTGHGKIVALHLKETKPGIYQGMELGESDHVQYVKCIKTALELGVRIYTANFWYQEGKDYKKAIFEANTFLRDKFQQASDELGLTVDPSVNHSIGVEHAEARKRVEELRARRRARKNS
ncbi:MAG: L-ribulose-5-phosphate 3-epimerase [Lachnospiraceae bacterium]|nr:L-ribulose-5-phosphate 3-epimerase [Lachnospiraceae bacterium]